jgi:hypothetical protein
MTHDYPACALFRGGKCTCDQEETMIETKTYPDGTTATGLRPLPILSPSDLTDEEILSLAEWPQFNMEEVHREVIDFARAVIAAALDKMGPR